MSADIFLSKLSRVRRTGQNSWVACCPAHDDKTPSLAVRDADDGRVLIHCFAGCPANEVLSAVGMDINDLFPERLAYNHGSMRRPFPAADVLECVAMEASIAHVAASNLTKGITLSAKDRERLGVAAQRLEQAREISNG